MKCPFSNLKGFAFSKKNEIPIIKYKNIDHLHFYYHFLTSIPTID